MATPAPEIGRAKKAGLLGAPGDGIVRGGGTPGPDAGYALTLADRRCRHTTLCAGESLHDLEAAVAALASKRAGLAGRGPTSTDVEAAAALCAADATDESTRTRRRDHLAGLGHSYSQLRAFCDTVDAARLTGTVEGSLFDA
jgi:hypothetical protein